LTVEPPRQVNLVAVRDSKRSFNKAGSGASETRKDAELLLCYLPQTIAGAASEPAKKQVPFSTGHRVWDVTGQSRVAAGASGGSLHNTNDIRTAVEVGAHFLAPLAQLLAFALAFLQRDLQRWTTAPNMASPDCWPLVWPPSALWISGHSSLEHLGHLGAATGSRDSLF
jgi:hypothetical protein